MVTLAAMLVVLGPLSMEAVLPALAQMEVHFRISTSSSQLIMSAWLVGSAVGQLLWGPVGDRVGRRPALAFSSAGFAGASAVCILAPAFEGLLLGRFLQGLATGGGAVLSRAVVRDWYSGERAVRLFGVLSSALFLAPMIGPVLGGFLATHFGWTGIYVFVGLWSLGALALIGTSLEESFPPDRRSSGRAPLWTVLAQVGRNRQFVLCSLIVAASSAGMFAFITGSPDMLINQMGMSPLNFGLSFLVVAAGFIAGVQLSRLLTPRGLRTRLAVGLAMGLVAGIALTLQTTSHGVVQAIGPCLLFYLGLGIVQPLSMAAALEPFQQTAGAAASLVGFGMMTTGAVASMIVGRLHDQAEVGIGLFFAVGSGVGLLAVAGLKERR
ncbi:MAG: Bcr/CflA family drug resistance efflux transporter [Candidatus Xenobia bacterium]